MKLGFEKFRKKNFEIKKKHFDIDISKFKNFETINFEIILGTKFRNFFNNFKIPIRNSKISKFLFENPKISKLLFGNSIFRNSYSIVWILHVITVLLRNILLKVLL